MTVVLLKGIKTEEILWLAYFLKKCKKLIKKQAPQLMTYYKSIEEKIVHLIKKAYKGGDVLSEVLDDLELTSLEHQFMSEFLDTLFASQTEKDKATDVYRTLKNLRARL